MSGGGSVAALYQGTLVAGASSHTVYRGGIEIEIDTWVDFPQAGPCHGHAAHG